MNLYPLSDTNNPPLLEIVPICGKFGLPKINTTLRRNIQRRLRRLAEHQNNRSPLLRAL